MARDLPESDIVVSGEGLSPLLHVKSRVEFAPEHYVRNDRNALFRTWRNMMSRCHNPKHEKYRFYGGRGIEVCDRWRESFLNFVDDMGPRPDGLTLERDENDKGYFLGNCRWATWEQQHFNQRKTVRVNGISLSETARRAGMPREVVVMRVNVGIERPGTGPLE